MSRCFSRSFGYLAIVSLLLITVPGPLGQASAASDDDDQAPSKLTLAKKSLQEQNYEAAIAELMALHQQDSKDADVLNLLGFAHRKLCRPSRGTIGSPGICATRRRAARAGSSRSPRCSGARRAAHTDPSCHPGATPCD